MKYSTLLSSGLGIIFSLFLIGCTTTNTSTVPETPKTTEQKKSTFQEPQESVRRIITLTSLSTDIIYQLDKSKLVGITGSRLINQNPKFKDIPRVSEERTPPNLEKILALKPDLVIGAEGFSNQITDRLKELGIKTLLTKVNSWESLEELTKNLAQLTGTDPKPLLNRYQNFLKTDSNCTNDKCKVSTLVIVSRQPILSPNKLSWAGNLLTKFPVKNITADLQGKSPVSGYTTLSPEKILEANPEVIIIVSNPRLGSPQEILDSFKREPFWNKLKAAQNNRVYIFDYYGLVNAGSIDSIEKATQQLQAVLSVN